MSYLLFEKTTRYFPTLNFLSIMDFLRYFGFYLFLCYLQLFLNILNLLLQCFKFFF